MSANLTYFDQTQNSLSRGLFFEDVVVKANLLKSKKLLIAEKLFLCAGGETRTPTPRGTRS